MISRFAFHHEYARPNLPLGARGSSPKAQRTFNNCDFNLPAPLAFPSLNGEGCRVSRDLRSLFFAIDDYSDVATGHGAHEQADIVMDALRNPLKPRPRGEWIDGEVSRQFQ